MLTTIENELIRMRAPIIEDAQALLNLSQDNEVMEYYGMEAFHSIKDAEKEIQWFINLEKEENGARWVIAEKETNLYIGDVGVFNYESNHKRIEIGFKLKKEYWKKGIMSFCIQQVLEYGFKTQNYNRIEALIDKRNIGCIRTIIKNGFTQEGLLREYEYDNNVYVDLFMYSILKKEYLKRKTT